MKREIKFRGKRTDNGDWVYGDLEYNRKNKSTRIHTYTPDGYYNRQYFVVNETVGQFTGLLDKHGTEIYEGDIIKFRHVVCEEDGIETWFSKVTFSDGVFCIEDDADYSVFYAQCASEQYGGIEVVGNIYDNPELLKGGEK